MAPHSSSVAWKTPWTESAPGGATERAPGGAAESAPGGAFAPRNLPSNSLDPPGLDPGNGARNRLFKGRFLGAKAPPGALSVAPPVALSVAPPGVT